MKRNNHPNQQGEFVPGRRATSCALTCTLVIPFAIFAVSLFAGSFGVAAVAFALIVSVAWLIFTPDGFFDVETRAIKAARAHPAGIPLARAVALSPLIGRVTLTDTPPPRFTRIA